MKAIEKFQTYYQQENQRIKKALEEYNASFIEEENPWIRDNLVFFQELNQDGKNIRGTLVNLGYYLLKEDRDYSNSLALAYEIFQTAILVHDDIIDKDKTRRNKKTIHYQNQLKYQRKEKKKEELTHFSNSVALCMGDYGLYSANQVISQSYQEDPNLGKVLNCFQDTVLKTIKGELLDVILPFQAKHKSIQSVTLENTIMEIERLKTSHYTIIGPLSVGLLLAGAKENQINDIANFGEKVGIAFQIQDDILGIYSDSMGKVKGSDIKEGKETLLFAHCLRTPYAAEIQKYYGQEKVTSSMIQKVQTIFEKSGSKEYAFSKMNQLYDESLELLNQFTWIEESKKEIIQGFVEYLRNRQK